MKVRTCFILFNYILAALGIWCLAFIETFSLPAILALLAALAVCMYYEFRKILPLKPPKGVTLIRAALVLSPVVYFALSPSIVDFTGYALAFILLTRFIFKTALNDYLFGHLLAVVCLLTGAIFISDIVFGLIFLAFYIVLCWNLIFYNMMVERVGSDCPPEKFKSVGEHELAQASLFGLSGTMVVASLILTIAIFVSFPRLGLGFMALNTKAAAISGFSETVRLGDVGKIKLNESVVMRVEFKKDSKSYRPESNILWRGVALDHYENQQWATTMPRAMRMKKRPGYPLNLFTVNSPENVVQQDIYMEAFDSPVIFTHGIPMTVDGNFREIQMDQGYVLKTVDKNASPKRFTMVSDIGQPDLSYSTSVPSNLGNIYPSRFLQLSKLHPDIVKLASDMTGSASTKSQIADQILKRLKNNYGYSLDLVHETDHTGLYEFLFIRKKGHCEYFASAMVILLRLNGIPARMVNGFSGGEWNEMGDYLIVRQKHAHSWVEAYMPGKGWAVYDPTPPDPGAAIQTSHALGHSMDLMRLYWQRYVVKYTMKDQERIVNFFNQESRDMIKSLKSLKTLKARDVLRYMWEKIWIPIIAGGIILLLILLRKNAWRWPGLAGTTKTPYAVTLYRQMLKRCARLGVIKQSTQTHTEFLKRAATLPADKKQAIEQITAFYEQCRFGARPAPAKQRKQMQSLLQQI